MNAPECRAHPRIPIALVARVSGDGADELGCDVRDFCLGGLFLVAREFDGDYIVLGRKQVAVDDVLRVHFTVELEGEGVTYEVHARVAGVWGGGMGVEFIEPDPDAVHALHRLSHQQTQAGRPATRADPTGTGSVAEAARAAELLNECRSRLEQFLRRTTSALFSHAGEALFGAARDARSNVEQNELFDLIKAVEKLKPPIEKEFVDTLLEQYDHLGEPLPDRDSPTGEGGVGGRLSLVDTLNFNDWLTVKNILTRREPKYREVAYETLRRLSHLAGVEVDEVDNPVGINALCISFHDAMQNLGADRVARRRLFEGFEACVVEEIPLLYTQLNQVFQDAGVEVAVDRPTEVVKEKSPDPPAPSPAAVDSEAAAAAPVEQTTAPPAPAVAVTSPQAVPVPTGPTPHPAGQADARPAAEPAPPVAPRPPMPPLPSRGIRCVRTGLAPRPPPPTARRSNHLPRSSPASRTSRRSTRTSRAVTGPRPCRPRADGSKRARPALSGPGRRRTRRCPCWTPTWRCPARRPCQSRPLRVAHSAPPGAC